MGNVLAPTVIPEPQQSNFWRYMISRAHQDRPVAALVLTYAWARGAAIAAHSNRTGITMPGMWTDASWMCWVLYQANIKELPV